MRRKRKKESLFLLRKEVTKEDVGRKTLYMGKGLTVKVNEIADDDVGKIIYVNPRRYIFDFLYK